MDPNAIALLVGAAGIVGTLAGVVVAYVLDGRRDKARRLRERRLLALQQTKQLIHAHLMDGLQVATGEASSRTMDPTSTRSPTTALSGTLTP